MHSQLGIFIAYVLSFLFPAWKHETKRFFRFCVYSPETMTPANFIRLYLADWNLVYAGEANSQEDYYIVPDCDGLAIIICPKNCEVILQVDKMQISNRDRKRIHARFLSVPTLQEYQKEFDEPKKKELNDNRYGHFGERTKDLFTKIKEYFK